MINALLDNVSLTPGERHTLCIRAVSNVTNEKFNTIAKCCFFHFTQCIHRKVIELS